MPNCSRCGFLVRDASDKYCGECGIPLAAGPAANGSATPPVVSQRPTVSVETLRSSGESLALMVGFVLLGISWLFFDFVTGVLPLVIGTLFLIVYVIYQHGALKGSGVAVTPRNFPEVHALAEQAAARLGIGKPNLFIKHSRELNAYAMGFVGSSCVVLHSEIVQATERSPGELQFIIGHEFTHVKCAHTLWQTLAARNPILGRIPILNVVLPLFFSWWSRQAEFTADRGGLIACGDLGASQRALARLAIGAELFERLNIDEFIKQAFDGDVATRANELLSSHPLLAKRIIALADFAASPAFARIGGLRHASAAG